MYEPEITTYLQLISKYILHAFYVTNGHGDERIQALRMDLDISHSFLCAHHLTEAFRGQSQTDKVLTVSKGRDQY
jgi:hypothetical protein